MSDKKYVIVITPDGIVMTFTWHPENELDSLQKIVGGYIEIAPTELSNFCMVVNEEGKLLDFPVNTVASEILPRAMQKIDCICGTAVLMKRGREDLEPLSYVEVFRWKKIFSEITNKEKSEN